MIALKLSHHLLILSVMGLILACGKENTTQDRPLDSSAPAPVYPVLPDTAPLRDQLDEAAAFVEREFLEEQEKYFLKRGEEIGNYYRGPDGAPLIPDSSVRKMLEPMQTPSNPRLKVACRRIHLRVSQDTGGVREAPETTTVRMLGNEVPAKGEYAGKDEGTRLRVLADYEYPNGLIQRDILYQKQPDGRWRRVRIQESGSPQQNAAPVPMAPEIVTPHNQRPPR